MKENTKIRNREMRFPAQNSKKGLRKYKTKSLMIKFSAPVKTNPQTFVYPFTTEIRSLSINSLVRK
jgi:hypothetical protein